MNACHALDIPDVLAGHPRVGRRDQFATLALAQQLAEAPARTRGVQAHVGAGTREGEMTLRELAHEARVPGGIEGDRVGNRARFLVVGTQKRERQLTRLSIGS